MTHTEIMQLIFNIINSIGVLATFGAFLFLFRKDKDKQKQIDKLSSIAKTMAKLHEIEENRLKLSVAPVLWLNGAGTSPSGELHIDLNNKGERAILDDFILMSGDITIHSKSIPYDLEKGERRNIFGRTNGNKSISECEYEIEVLYHDSLNYKFSMILKGKGAYVKIVSNNEI